MAMPAEQQQVDWSRFIPLTGLTVDPAASKPDFMKNKGGELLWGGRAQPSTASGERSPFAVPPDKTGQAATIPSGQSRNDSIAPLTLTGQTKAQVQAQQEAEMRHMAIVTLNVAGPRESKRPGIYAAARAFLDRLARVDVYEPTECRLGITDPEAPGYVGTYTPWPRYETEPAK